MLGSVASWQLLLISPNTFLLTDLQLMARIAAPVGGLVGAAVDALIGALVAVGGLVVAAVGALVGALVAHAGQPTHILNC